LSGLNYTIDNPFSAIVTIFAIQFSFAFGIMVIVGLILASIGQIIKAVVNYADQTREILMFLKEKNMALAESASKLLQVQ
jgi:hypothetical protein